MAPHLEKMPLFPLHAVLLPYERMQLHVFEPRYLEMVEWCQSYDAAFGVVQIREGLEVGGDAEPFLVGTAARIETVHRYPDGRLHLQVSGERRFRIRRLEESLPYLVGQVEPIVEMEAEDLALLQSLQDRTSETFGILIKGLLARPDFSVEIQLPDDPGMLAFVVARFLNLDNPTKQRVLETTCPVHRLQVLLPLIERQITEARAQVLRRFSREEAEEWIHPN